MFLNSQIRSIAAGCSKTFSHCRATNRTRFCQLLFSRASQNVSLATSVVVLVALLTSPSIVLAKGTSNESKAAVTKTTHPISVISTDVYVTRSRVNMRLSIFAEDLYLFHSIDPDEFDQISPDDLRSAMEEHKSFLLERVKVIDASGEALSGKVTGFEPFEIPEEGVAVGRLMEFSMVYQLEFDLETEPEFLTFTQEIVDANFVFPSEMQLFLKQSGSESEYQTVLRPKEPYTIRFDWDSPPLSPEADEKAWEEWFNQQREATLGITSYSSVYSFLYITPREVRHEILIPLVTLATMVTIEHADENFLDIEEQDRAKEAIEEFFKDVNPLKIDGIEVQPNFDRIDFYGLDLRDFAMQADRRKVSMANGRVGIIISYPAKVPPQQVDLTWSVFGSDIVSVESVIFAYNETLKKKFSRFNDEIDNTYSWSSDNRPEMPELSAIGTQAQRMRFSIPGAVLFLLAIPVALIAFFKLRTAEASLLAASLVIVVAVTTWAVTDYETKVPFTKGPAALSEAEQDSVFERLHANTYRAFDYSDEEEIYDALQASIDGDLLREMYLNVRRGLEMQSQGGAIADIESVSLIDGTAIEDKQLRPGFDYECRWQVRGTVEHWGHIHERTNEYVGRFTVEPRDDSWKITSMELVDEQQIRVRTGMRKF